MDEEAIMGSPKETPASAGSTSSQVWSWRAERPKTWEQNPRQAE